MCQGRSGDKTVTTAQTMSLVQRSDGKIKAVWSGLVPSVKRSCPGDISSFVLSRTILSIDEKTLNALVQVLYLHIVGIITNNTHVLFMSQCHNCILFYFYSIFNGIFGSSACRP